MATARLKSKPSYPVYVMDNIDALKESRESRGVSRQVLALVTGLNQEVIAQYERGYGYPTQGMYNKLADFFGWKTWRENPKAIGLPDFVDINLRSIKTIRKHIGWSQAYVAKEAGITKQDVSLYEQGKRIPTKNTYNKLAKFFDWEIWN